MDILITGATGFLGTALSAHLEGLGHRVVRLGQAHGMRRPQAHAERLEPQAPCVGAGAWRYGVRYERRVRATNIEPPIRDKIARELRAGVKHLIEGLSSHTCCRLASRFLYGDFCTGRVWRGVKEAGGWRAEQLPISLSRLTTFETTNEL